MKEVEWTNTECIKLIEEYRKRPELWDVKHGYYRHQTTKHERWTEIAKIFNVDIAGLRKKLNTLLASHRRECVRIRNGGHTQWYAFPYMSFLPTHVPDDGNYAQADTSSQSMCDFGPSQHKQKPRPPIKEMPPSSPEPEPESEAEYLEFLDPESDADSGPQEALFIKKEAPPSPKRKKSGQIYKVGSAKHTVKQSPRFDRKHNTSFRTPTFTPGYDHDRPSPIKFLGRREKDECDSFGEYIADSLRKHDERTQSMIKQAINNIIFEQEMKKYSSHQYTVVYAGVDDNPLITDEQQEE